MRRHKRIKEEAELNVTSFMNLMIVLVPVLLLNMVFSQLAVLDLRLPKDNDQQNAVNPEEFSFSVTVRKSGFTLARTQNEETVTLAAIPAAADGLNYDELANKLIALKKNPGLEKKTDIALLAEADIDYQTLVTVMDTVRVYPTITGEQPLFPDISLGDAEQVEVAQ